MVLERKTVIIAIEGSKTRVREKDQGTVSDTLDLSIPRPKPPLAGTKDLGRIFLKPGTKFGTFFWFPEDGDWEEDLPVTRSHGQHP